MVETSSARMVKLDAHFAGLGLWVGIDGCHVVDGSGGDACLFQFFQPFGGGFPDEGLFQLGFELGNAGGAGWVVGKAGVGEKVETVEDLAEFFPVGLVGCADVDVAVGGAERLVGRAETMGGTFWLGGLSGGKVNGGFPDGVGDACFKKGGVYVLSLTCAEAIDVGVEDAKGGVHACVEVGDGDADFNGWAVGVSGDAHDAGHALRDEVKAAAFGVGSGLSKAGDGTVDEPGVVGAEGGVAETEGFHCTGAEVFDEDVGARGKLAKDLDALRLFEEPCGASHRRLEFFRL